MSINRIVIMGRLTDAPEKRQTPAGISVANFSVAVDRPYKDESTGERKTDFFRVVAWRQSADFVAKYFTKGDMIAIDGVLQNHGWVDKHDQKRVDTEIVADMISFCGGKNDKAKPDERSGNTGNAISGFKALDDDTQIPF